jgi:hypothetical protein
MSASPEDQAVTGYRWIELVEMILSIILTSILIWAHTTGGL